MNGSKAATVLRLMIFNNPSDALLASADVITLFDPGRPNWDEVIVGPPPRPRLPEGFIVVDIPVDSTDLAAVQGWREKISAARTT